MRVGHVRAEISAPDGRPEVLPEPWVTLGDPLERALDSLRDRLACPLGMRRRSSSPRRSRGLHPHLLPLASRPLGPTEVVQAFALLELVAELLQAVSVAGAGSRIEH